MFVCFREEGREKERGKHRCARETSIAHFSQAPHWGPGCNAAICPNWESNQRPFGSQAGAQCTKPHQPGHKSNAVIQIYLCEINTYYYY